MGASKGGRDMEKCCRDVAEMGLGRFEVATSFLRSRHGRQWGRSRHEFLVSRPGKSHCGQKRGRDMKLMSRHRLVSRKVATWFWC